MVRLQLLGPPDLRRQDGTSLHRVLSQPKRLALLAYLALARPRGFHRRDSLLAMFWGELSQRRARRALRQALFFLRRSLGSELLPARGSEQIGIDRDLLRTDVEELEKALRPADGATRVDAAGRRPTPDTALQTVVTAPFLDGFHVSGAPGFERWLDEERTRLRALGREAAARLAREAEAAGDLKRALRRSALGLRLDPLDERAARRVIEMNLRRGDRAGALAVWKEIDARCRRELGESTTVDLDRLLATVQPSETAGGPSEEPEEPDSEIGAERRPGSTVMAVEPTWSEAARADRTRSTWARQRFAIAVFGVLSVAAAGVVLGHTGFPFGAEDSEATRSGRSVEDAGRVLEPDLGPTGDAEAAALPPEGPRAILWVDDNPGNNETERRRLRAHGIRITSARSTTEALDLYDPNAFQLVISDMGRYEAGKYQPRAGLELLSRLRERSETVRVVLYTSSGAVADFAEEAEAESVAGITDSPDELLRLIY